MREVEATAKRLQDERKESDALSFEDIELMVGNRVNAAHLIDRIKQHGVNFELTPEQRTQLKAEKVDDSVLDTMVKARKK
jgi:hypothetical protein